MVTNLIDPGLVGDPVYVVLLNFSKQYKNWMIKSRCGIEVLLPVEIEKSEIRREADIGGLQNQYMVNPRPKYSMPKNQYR